MMSRFLTTHPVLILPSPQTAAEGDNRYGQKNSVYPVLETYDEGSILEVKIVASTWHFVSFNA